MRLRYVRQGDIIPRGLSWRWNKGPVVFWSDDRGRHRWRLRWRPRPWFTHEFVSTAEIERSRAYLTSIGIDAHAPIFDPLALGQIRVPSRKIEP